MQHLIKIRLTLFVLVAILGTHTPASAQCSYTSGIVADCTLTMPRGWSLTVNDKPKCKSTTRDTQNAPDSPSDVVTINGKTKPVGADDTQDVEKELDLKNESIKFSNDRSIYYCLIMGTTTLGQDMNIASLKLVKRSFFSPFADMGYKIKHGKPQDVVMGGRTYQHMESTLRHKKYKGETMDVEVYLWKSRTRMIAFIFYSNTKTDKVTILKSIETTANSF